MDTYRMVYAGGAAAMLPGVCFAAIGLPGLIVALVFSLATVLGYAAIRNGLGRLGWYRWYFALIAASGFALGLFAYLWPDVKTIAVLSWGLAQLFILGGFYPLFSGDEPPPNQANPRG